MKTVKASDFKAQCSRLINEVAQSGEPIVISRHGKPVARLSSYRVKPESLFGALKGSLLIKGDVISLLKD